jgi:hypothetical protein
VAVALDDDRPVTVCAIDVQAVGLRERRNGRRRRVAVIVARADGDDRDFRL